MMVGGFEIFIYKDIEQSGFHTIDYLLNTQAVIDSWGIEREHRVDRTKRSEVATVSGSRKKTWNSDHSRIRSSVNKQPAAWLRGTGRSRHKWEPERLLNWRQMLLMTRAAWSQGTESQPSARGWPKLGALSMRAGPARIISSQPRRRHSPSELTVTPLWKSAVSGWKAPAGPFIPTSSSPGMYCRGKWPKAIPLM